MIFSVFFRSQDRLRTREAARIPLYNVNSAYVDTIYYPDNKCQKVESIYHQPHHTLKTSNHLSKGTADFSPGRHHKLDFSPGRHYNGTSEDYVKRRCEVFCENEILNHKDCNCYKCKRDMERDLESPKSPARAAFQKMSNGHAHRRCENISDSDGVEDRVKVVPFNTDRLNPTRAELKNIVLSILKNGDVCVERLKQSKGKKLVVEVVRISGNGLKVCEYNFVTCVLF